MKTFMKHSKYFRFFTLLTLLLVMPAALAEPDFIDGDMGLPEAQENNSLINTSEIETSESTPPAPNYSPADAADKVRARVGGQIMNVSTQQGDSGVIYNVKVLNSGRMKIIHVDGQTGQLLNNE